MKAGDLWTEFFRGARYNFGSSEGIFYQYPVSFGGQRLSAKGYPSGLLADLERIKGAPAGRLYVTEGLDVLVVKEGTNNGKHGWYPYFVSRLDKPFSFPDFDSHFVGLVHGDVWPGFNFHAGSHFSYSGQRWDYTLYWRLRRNDSIHPLSSKHNKLRQALISTDRRGGVFYVTEHGQVWKPMERKFVNASAIERLKKRPDHILRTIRLYYDFLEGRLPVFVGQFNGRYEISDYIGPTEVANDSEF
ncbi:MAG: hypothetical protein M1422_02515 [Candidatus Thermoplasmatota archaeon]|jgi:hypothetical protein|nr:hypothetical protein [Candidatus Thermoplasmatota archaeon]MCL5253383.1 hypothetical protein [Candidatus Thermoplasmatota archaeon]